MEGATAGAAMTMATLLSTITEVFTASIGWVGTVAESLFKISPAHVLAAYFPP